VERCALRSGNAHSADDWRRVLERVAAGSRCAVKRRYAALANAEIYEFLEGLGYAAGQPGRADRIGYLPQASDRATAERGPPLLRQLQLSRAELGEAPPSGGTGGVAHRRALSRVGCSPREASKPTI
jgi:hypothetical protein